MEGHDVYSEPHYAIEDLILEEILRRVQKMASDLKNTEFIYDYAGSILLVNPPLVD